MSWDLLYYIYILINWINIYETVEAFRRSHLSDRGQEISPK